MPRVSRGGLWGSDDTERWIYLNGLLPFKKFLYSESMIYFMLHVVLNDGRHTGDLDGPGSTC